MKTSSMSRLAASLLATSLFLLGADAARAQTLSRGPYLQNANTSAVTVRWRTSSNTDSVLRYGTSAGNLNLSVSNGTAKTEHELRATGLSPDTKYYYSVGSVGATLASGTDHFFVTAPSSAKPTRVWVVGDPGTGNSSQTAVRNAYTNYTGARGTDLWLMLGDNAYNDGTDAEYTSKLFAVYPTVLRNSVVWPTLGNHDGHTSSSSSQSGPYYASFTLPRNAEAGGVASGTEAYYSFDHGNIHFVCLNSYDVDRSATGTMANWLRNDLAANTKDWLVAFFHHPPYSKGSHNSDTETELLQMRTNLVPILEQHGVDLVLSGHSHSYERSYLLDGHYGTSGTLTSAMIKNNGSGREDGTGAYMKPTLGPGPREGTVYAVPGASGQTGGGTLNHPAMFVSMNVLGSMILDIDGDRLDAKYLDSVGTIRDYFTLVKGGAPANVPPTVSITSPGSGAVFGPAPVNVTINASASDSDGTVTGVAFFNGSTLLGSDATSPYSFVWNGVGVGNYSLTAVATDDDGATRTSAPVAISVTSGGAPVTVTFRNGASGYNGMIDASIRSDAATTNYGSALSLLADGDPADYASLLKWDVAAIPAGKTVTAASITVRVFDVSSNTYELYGLKRNWVEGQVTWTRAASGVNWQTAGASGANDRETTVIGSITGSSAASYTITLNAAGRTLVQSWINTPSSNFGLILLDYANTNGLDLRSSEYTTTTSYRPTLSVTYQ